MSTFTERQDELTPELREAREWLAAEVRHVASGKALQGLEWRLRFGRRENGGAGGVPRLSQRGFQITALRHGH